VIADYKAREEKKKATKDDKDTKGKESTVPAPAPIPVPVPTSTPPTSAQVASHRKFALHRQIFEMRRDDIKRKEQGVKAREVGKGEFHYDTSRSFPGSSSLIGLPQVPRGMF
jgi:hypothetical protein